MLNERRRLDLEAAGVSPTLLDGNLYKTIRNVKQQVPYDNNESERFLRPAKTKIKVCGQFKTMEGAQTYATLLSIILNCTEK